MQSGWFWKWTHIEAETMAWSKAVTLWCDEDGCLQHTGNIPESRVRAARRYAREKEGWVYRDGDDLCPEHA